MAKIYEFPNQINGLYTEAYIEWSYKSFYDEEENEYIMNQSYQDQNEQRKNKPALLHGFVKKIISIFQ